MATYSAHDVAAELRARVPNLPVKKMHKLLYYCQGWHLASFGEPLFHETISAWDMGPVVGQLWHIEKRSGPAQMGMITLDEAAKNTVGYVLSRYGRLSGLDLEHLTHSETPWRAADANRMPGQSVKIPTDTIRQFFRESSAGDESEAPPLDSESVEQWLKGAPERLADELSADSVESMLARLR